MQTPKPTNRPASIMDIEAQGTVDIFNRGELEKAEYVWQLPVRITHWVNVLSIAILAITGIYMAHPFVYDPNTFFGISWLTTLTGGFFMGTVRFIHFVTAFVFTTSVLFRLYWMFVGNKYASWRQYVPVKRERRRGIRRMFGYYFFARPVPPAMIGHNPLAGMAYTVLLVLYILQILTGFALYSIPFHGGFWPAVFGWVVVVVGISVVRVAHAVLMWMMLAFLVHHVYTAILIDIEEHSGLMSSIFTGYKYISASHRAAAEAEDMPNPPGKANPRLRWFGGLRRDHG
jgi:Ni/Fe-hydrogenase 1 B-type cytochrome subunit